MSMLRDPARRPGALCIVRVLFDRLRSESIAYCHWKSNEHLAAAVAGDTDLDVLVDRDATQALNRILAELDFKRCTAAAGHAYPGVEDFLGFDTETGRLAHLHLHHRLVLGEKRLKGFRLPWEDVLLSSRRFDHEHGVYVADPNLELLLLVIRSALRLRTRDIARSISDQPALGEGTLREFRWLAERVTPDGLVSAAGPLVGEEAARLLAVAAVGNPTARELRVIADRASPALCEYRTYAASDALQRRWSREWTARWGRIRDRFGGRVTPSKHTLPQGGLVIAFLGCDGSGKSTLAKATAAWLSWKLDVVPIYFGSGKGPASIVRQPLRLLKSLRRTRSPRQSSGARRDGVGVGRGLRGVRDAWWMLALARERRSGLARAQRARNLGMVVICDRFPQNQVLGFNDSPRLGSWREHSSSILRALAQREQAAYRAAASCPPDLVLKLHVATDVAVERKPEMAREWIAQRAEAIRDLRFPPATRVVDIDANPSLDQVLLQVKQAIWDHL
jgi:hypothetical protein